jgi:16S rRNA (adenine(1408)-N(1))-methyltransferase
VTLVRVVGKGRTSASTPADLVAWRGAARRTVVDIGTGDGRYAYALATEHPDWFVIGIDALEEPMGEIAHKAARKPAKGGRSNVVFVRAAIEALPGELRNIADEVHVVLPWGRLLEGIVLGDDAVVGGLAALGGALDVVLNGEIWEESLPVRYEHLPVPTPEYVADKIAPAFALHGITIGPGRYLSADEAKSIPSTWARKLGHGRAHPRYVHFTGRPRA